MARSRSIFTLKLTTLICRLFVQLLTSFWVRSNRSAPAHDKYIRLDMTSRHPRICNATVSHCSAVVHRLKKPPTRSNTLLALSHTACLYQYSLCGVRSGHDTTSLLVTHRPHQARTSRYYIPECSITSSPPSLLPCIRQIEASRALTPGLLST
jgi:hypothetical protein